MCPKPIIYSVLSDEKFSIICEIIGANFLLSSPGYFRTNPDAIYKKYKTLQKCHNAFNSVKIICVDDAHASTQPELSISTEDAENVQNLDAIDLKRVEMQLDWMKTNTQEE